MTDRAIAGQLRALADDYQRRAEKASLDDAAKAWLNRLLALNASGSHELLGSVATGLEPRRQSKAVATRGAEQEIAAFGHLLILFAKRY
jgi:hypothetical protein